MALGAAEGRFAQDRFSLPGSAKCPPPRPRSFRAKGKASFCPYLGFAGPGLPAPSRRGHPPQNAAPAVKEGGGVGDLPRATPPKPPHCRRDTG